MSGAALTEDFYSPEWHIVPTNDIREHESSKDCFCKPIPDEKEPSCWIHNSLDGREAFERGERLAS